jgi:tetratricopeptide (TPR) repeat protein
MISKEKLLCVKCFEDGRALYRTKKFKDAIDKFNEALNYDPEDVPSKVFIDRCNYFIEHPVPEDWDGVFEMKTK